MKLPCRHAIHKKRTHFLIGASSTGRRISAFENVGARLFASAEMVEIDRAAVCVGVAPAARRIFCSNYHFL
jgi:hypothetical protein